MQISICKCLARREIGKRTSHPFLPAEDILQKEKTRVNNEAKSPKYFDIGENHLYDDLKRLFKDVGRDKDVSGEDNQ